MKKIFVFSLLSVLLFSCRSLDKLTLEERNNVLEATADVPFRVLLTTNKADSLILRTKCKDVDAQNDGKVLSLLIARLRKTLEVERGVGIAAPQVGISRNLFLFMRVDKKGKPVEVVINPKIVAHSAETVCFERDGCLSVPTKSGNSVRYAWIEVQYQNEKGEVIHEILNGYSRKGNFVAVIFQHEFDHLQAVIFTDKLCQ